MSYKKTTQKTDKTPVPVIEHRSKFFTSTHEPVCGGANAELVEDDA